MEVYITLEIVAPAGIKSPVGAHLFLVIISVENFHKYLVKSLHLYIFSKHR